MEEKELLVKTLDFNIINQLINLKDSPTIIAGPCSIESVEQMEIIAKSLVKKGVGFIRGGAYKPRTSPYDFQGLEERGLEILDHIRKKYNLKAVTEILDTRDIQNGIEHADILQIGSRNMHNYALLKEIGKTRHPVLLKRGMMSTLEEFIYAAEYIVCNGNENVILCERGIRTFENSTRNTLDVSSIAILKKYTSIPIIVDLSHSLGRKDILKPISDSVLALGVDGIMIEVHPNPVKAYSDNQQQLSVSEFEDYMEHLDI